VTDRLCVRPPSVPSPTVAASRFPYAGGTCSERSQRARQRAIKNQERKAKKLDLKVVPIDA
jgi:hypothetical protein